jgi:hypothetical protein
MLRTTVSHIQINDIISPPSRSSCDFSMVISRNQGQYLIAQRNSVPKDSNFWPLPQQVVLSFLHGIYTPKNYSHAEGDWEQVYSQHETKQSCTYHRYQGLSSHSALAHSLQIVTLYARFVWKNCVSLPNGIRSTRS